VPRGRGVEPLAGEALPKGARPLGLLSLDRQRWHLADCLRRRSANSLARPPCGALARARVTGPCDWPLAFQDTQMNSSILPRIRSRAAIRSAALLPVRGAHRSVTRPGRSGRSPHTSSGGGRAIARRWSGADSPAPSFPCSPSRGLQAGRADVLTRRHRRSMIRARWKPGDRGPGRNS